MNKTSIALAALAALGAAASAQAADIQMYGRVDAGLVYEHSKGEDTLEMDTSRSHNRVGFNIVEDLGNGMKVKAYLENGFYVDSGTLDDATMLFNRRSILAVQGAFGEVGFGRMGTVQSSMAPYSMGIIKFDPFGTSYGQASVGSNFSNTSRTNNTITWVSPTVKGLRAGASYSLGDASDENYADLADRQHTAAFAVTYTGADVYLTLTYGNIDYGNKEAAAQDKNGQTVAFGGWYRIVPASKIFFGAQYSTHWEKGGGFTATKVAGATAIEQSRGFDGASLLLGADYVVGRHKVIGGVQYYTGELSENAGYDFQRTIVAAAYEYKLAEKTWLYFAATHSMGGGSLEKAADDLGVTKTTQVMAGLNINW